MSLQDLYYNLRRREQRSNESFDEMLQRRSARNEADRFRRARKRSDQLSQPMANIVHSQIEVNIPEHSCGNIKCYKCLRSAIETKSKFSWQLKTLYAQVKEIAAKLDIKEEIPRVCRLRTARNNVPDSTEEYYRRAVYVPYLDNFCNSLKERFESHKETVASLQHILPEFCTKTDFYSLEAAFNFYEEYLSHKEVVQSEFMSWKEKWSQEKSENFPKTAISSLEKCDKTFFPNIYILLKLLAVVPVSVATVERSFSSLRRLKTYLRNTTSESRLNGLALLSIHRNIKIRDEVLDKFASVPRNLDFVL
ncbi:repressor of the inhibitor of the protein kinase [Araneus ventricosus]|uniref:Repressor of the inhibitor of the protein kinase n=1 Tax=Araneus ventricosus TaxID=182803 RepID=A0A4Y2AS89_ARAVE|nr:repressor of the inhibitor of the protein kinase [Araneus ventricosus]